MATQSNPQKKQKIDGTPMEIEEIPTGSIAIASTSVPPTTTRFPDDAVPYFRVCRKLTLNRNKSIHHSDYLRHCLKEKITPKGLQAKVPPQVPEPNIDFTIKWEKAHLKFFKELTQLLSEYYAERVQTLNRQIDTTRLSLKELCSDSQMSLIEGLISSLAITQQTALEERRTRKTEGSKNTNRPLPEPKSSTSQISIFQSTTEASLQKD